MAYNTKEIVRDKDGNPISQYYNSMIDKYEAVEGSGGGNKVVLYNEDGTENNELSLIPILDKLSQLTGTVIDEETRKANEIVRVGNEDIRIVLYNNLLQQLDRISQITEQVPQSVLDSVNTLRDTIGELQSLETIEKSNIVLALNEIFNNLKTHKAEIVSQVINVTRDVSLVGIQSISTTRKAKSIIVTSSVNGSKKMSIGTVNRCTYQVNDTGNYASGGYAIIIADTSGNRTFGLIQNITDTGFEINWVHGGTGATGTADIVFTIIYHGGD